jgi:hypothetical protein
VATDRARDLAAEARDEVRRQTDTQRERLAGTLHQLGDELRSMSGQGEGSGIATEIARQAGDRVHGLGSYVEHHQPGDLLEDVRSFARRRPGTFLLGAVAAGVLAGRLTRGAKAAASSSGDSSGPSYGATPGAAGTGATWSTDAGYAASRPAGGYAATPPPVTPPATTPGTGPVYETEVEVIAVETEPGTGRTGGNRP